MRIKGKVVLTLAAWEKLQQRLHTAPERQQAFPETRVGVVPENRNSPPPVPAPTPDLQYVVQIVRFAVANLPPETVPGWPHEALQAFALWYSDTYRGDGPAQELAAELTAFAREAAGHEARRGQRKAGLHGQALGTRELTPAAAAVHEAAGKAAEV